MLSELRRISGTAWTRFGILGLLLIGNYFSTYSWLIEKDWSRQDYSASILIPFVVLYLILEKLKVLNALPSSLSWGGIAVMVVGVILFWIGELGGEYYTLYYSSWLMVVGLCWMQLGFKKLKTIAFPVFLLLTMFPLPHLIHGKLSFNLKLISSLIGVKMMQYMGMSAYREGNVIDLGFTQLQVVDACNGLRYLIPLIILGLIIAFYFKAVWWKRVILVISTIPIAVFINSVRIASVGVLYQFWGPMVAEGFFHDFSGWFIFMLTVGLLMLLVWLLKNIPPITHNAAGLSNSGKELRSSKHETVGQGGEACADVKITPSLYTPHFLTATALLGITLTISFFVDFHEKTPSRSSLSKFPTEIVGWQGTRKSIEQEFIDTLDFSDYLVTDFRNAEGKTVNFYVAYYASQRKGESIHSPATCMPGGGWIFRESGNAEISMGHGSQEFKNVRRAYMQKGDVSQLTYYWFPMRGRTLTNAYEMKLYNFWDALTRQRTDGALVRVITPIYPGEVKKKAEQRLKQFVRDMVPVLDEFLPD